MGAFAASAFRLHDVHGNAAELVQDCYEDTVGGGTTCSGRVVRGGSWANRPELLRSAYRGWCARPSATIATASRSSAGGHTR